MLRADTPATDGPACARSIPPPAGLPTVRGMDTTELLTAGKIALELKVPGAKVKKAIATLKLKPVTKKGVCSYFARSDLPKIKKALA